MIPGLSRFEGEGLREWSKKLDLSTGNDYYIKDVAVYLVMMGELKKQKWDRGLI